MSSLFFTLVATFLTAIGARDQLIVLRLRESLGASGALLALAVATNVASAAVAAVIGAQLAEMLSSSAKTMFVAVALLLAAFELAWPNTVRTPREPTRSLGAIGITLFARQLTDASRFLVVAIAAATAYPLWAGIGGAIGGAAALMLIWSLSTEFEAKFPIRGLRLALSATLFGFAIIIGMSARGLLL